MGDNNNKSPKTHFFSSNNNNSENDSENNNIIKKEPYGRSEFRYQISQRLLPSMRAFNPDLIMISAGFDAGKGDLGCCKNGSYGSDLLSSDYEWITDQIRNVARICCDGRIVSSLEGGYGRMRKRKKKKKKRNSNSSAGTTKNTTGCGSSNTSNVSSSSTNSS